MSTLQVRNRGTLCGSVAHAFPTAEPAGRAGGVRCARAARALRPRGKRGRRGGLLRRPDGDRGRAGRTRAGGRSSPDAARRSTRTAYLKFAIRPLDFAIVGVAVRVMVGLRRHDHRRPDRPQRRRQSLPAGNRGGGECCWAPSRPTSCSARAGDAAAAQSQPLADVDGNEDYKRHVVGVYTRRALKRRWRDRLQRRPRGELRPMGARGRRGADARDLVGQRRVRVPRRRSGGDAARSRRHARTVCTSAPIPGFPTCSGSGAG